MSRGRRNKAFRRWALYTFIGLGLVFALSILTLPKWIFSGPVSRQVHSLLASEQIKLEADWEHRSAKWEGLGHLILEIKFKQICVFTRAEEGCAKNGSLKVGIWPSLSEPYFVGIKLSSVVLDSLDLKIIDEGPESESVPVPLPHFELPLKLEKFSLLYKSKEKELQSIGNLDCVESNGPKCSGAMEHKIDKGDKVYRVTTKLFPEKDKGTSLSLVVRKGSTGKTAKSLDAFIRVLRGTNGWQLSSVLSVFEKNEKSITMELDTAIKRSGNKLAIKNSGWFAHPKALFTKTSVKQCNIEIDFPPSKMSVSACEVTLRPAIRELPEIDIAASGESAASLENGKLAIEVRGDGEKLKLNSSIGIEVQSGVLVVSEHSKAKVHFKQFQILVSVLRNSPWEVPAPFNTLDGDLDVNFSSVKPEGSNWVLPIKVTANLRDSVQKLVVEADAVVRIFQDELKRIAARVDLDCILHEARFQLPSFHAQLPPALIPDPRLEITSEKEKKEEIRRVEVGGRVRTSDVGAVKLLTNLLNNPVPVGFDLTLVPNGKSYGAIFVKAFNVELFKRKAKVEKLRLTIPKGGFDKRTAQLDGMIQVPHTDYDVTLKIEGVVKNPKLILSSQPPLSQREITSLLLFGQIPNALDAGEERSVGQMDAAIGQRSVSVASLYLLASTPVQAVSYDPKTKSLGVAFRIGQKTSLHVSSGSGDREKVVGFRRRIGKNWAVSSEVQFGDEKKDSSTVSSYIDWFKGY